MNKTSHHAKRWMEKKCVKHIHLTYQIPWNETGLEYKWIPVSPKSSRVLCIPDQMGLTGTSPGKGCVPALLCVFGAGNSWTRDSLNLHVHISSAQQRSGLGPSLEALVKCGLGKSGLRSQSGSNHVLGCVTLGKIHDLYVHRFPSLQNVASNGPLLAPSWRKPESQ